MTENKPDLEVLPGGKDDNTVEIELNDQPEKEQTFSDEQIEQFYEENKDSIDMIGGLEMLEALLETPDEQFVILAPKVLEVLQSTLQDPQTRTEFRAYLQDKSYTAQDITDEARAFNEAIEQMDFLSESKKDVLKQAIAMSVNLLQEINNSMERIIEIPCEIAEGIELPAYANEGDAGLDIYSPKEYTINPGETQIIPTGIKVAIPKGYAILIQPRSGQSVKPIIDSILHGQAYTIAEGQRFAQMRLVQVPTASFVQVDSVANLGEDRGGGFGHTGE